MRMRKRHNLTPRMEACAAYLVKDPARYRGRWLAEHPGFSRLHVELGCGKGRFTVETAQAAPDTLMLAIEKVPDAMVLAMERAHAMGLSNVLFMDFDAAKLSEILAPGEVDRLYLNFSDPWPKSRDAKFRLTAPGFLRLYADALPLGGEIHFKTDNTPLFDWSLEQFSAESWALSQVTHDLHGNGPQGVMTDYEAKFVAEGLKINRLVASRTEKTKTTAAGPVPRLRNAALADARGAGSKELPLRLEEATLPLAHAFFRNLQQAPELFEDPADFVPYRYDPAQVDGYFARRAARTDRRDYYLLLGDQVIGSLGFKRISENRSRGELEICLVNDRVKNRGYGTRGIRLALERGFRELGLEEIIAEVLPKNSRSRHVLQKLGFRPDEEGRFCTYRLTRERYLRLQGEREA